VQDTLIEAMRKLSQFIQDRPIAFYPWLRQLAWNRLVDLYRFHIRGAKRRVDREMHMGTALSDESIASFAKYLVAWQPSPGSELVRSELRHRVRAALESLPEKYRESLAMRHLEQLSIREIATIVGAPEGTIKARLFRGLKILQQLLADPTTGVES
jgi:RNA polymerase sigma-70 factor (ECF subfamily)